MNSNDNFFLKNLEIIQKRSKNSTWEKHTIELITYQLHVLKLSHSGDFHLKISAYMII